MPVASVLRTCPAKDALDRFFAGKQHHVGGPVPRYLLHQPARLEMLATLSLRAAYVRAYRRLAEQRRPLDLSGVFELIRESAVPSAFFGGVLISYLEFCEGVPNEIREGQTYFVAGFGPAKVLYVHEKDVTIEVSRVVKEVYRQVCNGYVQPLPDNEEGVNGDAEVHREVGRTAS